MSKLSFLYKEQRGDGLKQSTVCPSCEQEFPSYYSLQQHRRKEHGAKQRKPSDTVADLNKIVEEEGENGEKLKEELSASQQFLVDTEIENGRHKVFNFQMSKLDTKIINEKLEEVFKKLDSAAKINIALGSVLRKSIVYFPSIGNTHERTYGSRF